MALAKVHQIRIHGVSRWSWWARRRMGEANYQTLMALATLIAGGLRAQGEVRPIWFGYHPPHRSDGHQAWAKLYVEIVPEGEERLEVGRFCLPRVMDQSNAPYTLSSPYRDSQLGATIKRFYQARWPEA